MQDVDLDQRLVVVTGKGRRTRGVGLGMKATKDLDRYIERERPAHPLASVEALWLGNRMPLQASGIAQMLRRRCDQAGIPRIHPHQLRHTFAHLWLAQGGGERDLMSLAGWKSPQMLGRYGASLAAERAREATNESRQATGCRSSVRPVRPPGTDGLRVADALRRSLIRCPGPRRLQRQ